MLAYTRKPRTITRLFPRAMALALSLYNSCWGASHTVSTLNDGPPGSLRQTILDSTPGDSIIFGVTGEIVLTNGEIVIDKNLRITGPGPKLLKLNANYQNRIFNVVTGNVEITGLTLSYGLAHGAPNFRGQGGGIYNGAILSLSNCVFDSNIAMGGDNQHSEGSGGLGQGGALYNYSAATTSVRSCTFQANIAAGGNGLNPLCYNMCLGGSAQGGAVFAGGAMSLVNCTFQHNSAQGSTNGTISGRGLGGAIYWTSFQPLYVVNCTIAENSALGSGTSDGGGFAVAFNTSPTNDFFWNTVIARNVGIYSAPDLIGSVVSRGHNLVGNASGSSGWIVSDLLGTAPNPIDSKLGPLQDNGGQTPTMVPVGGPAYNGGDDSVLLPPWNIQTDQRGEPRLSGVHVDIGAVEWAVPNIPIGFASDDFNDSMRDTNKWIPQDLILGTGRFTETNSRLEFVAAPGTNDYDESRLLFAKALPRTFDWAATLDAHLSPLGIPTGYTAGLDIVVTQSGIPQNRLTMGLWEVSDGVGADQMAFCSEAWVEGTMVSHSCSYLVGSDATFRVRYIATNQTLIAEYPVPAGTYFASLGTLSSSRWPIDVSPAFQIQVQAHSSKVTVNSGLMYADNFRVEPSIDPPVISAGRTREMITLNWATQEGLYYQIQQSIDLSNWENFGSSFRGLGAPMTQSISATSNHFALRLKVSTEP